MGYRPDFTYRIEVTDQFPSWTQCEQLHVDVAEFVIEMRDKYPKVPIAFKVTDSYECSGMEADLSESLKAFGLSNEFITHLHDVFARMYGTKGGET